MHTSELWDHAKPFFIEVTATQADMDSYGHVNNVVYIGWLENCAWAHSAAVGLAEARCLQMARGMAVRTINVDYLAACYSGDRISVGNWISANDGKLRVTRTYQLINTTTGITVMRGNVDFVCMNLERRRPVKMPVEFLEAYQPTIRI